jgi:hypothetical protein
VLVSGSGSDSDDFVWSSGIAVLIDAMSNVVFVGGGCERQKVKQYSKADAISDLS